MQLVKHKKSKHITITTGTKFHKLTILSLEGFYKKSEVMFEPVYKCQCDCGKIINLERIRFKYGNTKSCGCIQQEVVYDRFRKKRLVDDKTFYKHQLYDKYIRTSIPRKLVFSLDFELFDKLTNSNCTYCGRVPYTYMKYQSKDTELLYNGLDRKNNNLGYTKENVVSCCAQCNFLKGSMNYKEFIELVKLIANNVGSLSTAM